MTNAVLEDMHARISTNWKTPKVIFGFQPRSPSHHGKHYKKIIQILDQKKIVWPQCA